MKTTSFRLNYRALPGKRSVWKRGRVPGKRGEMFRTWEGEGEGRMLFAISKISSRFGYFFICF